ncbi:MAG: hypothetical protein IJ365_00620 [Clostridia bacterium]|nr:hypothetical protein [Clostridia bacterium]
MNSFDKNGFLYKSMVKYRLKFTVVFVLYVIVFAMFTASCADYLAKRAFGASALDVEAFAAECGTMTLDGGYTFDKDSPDAKIFGFAVKEQSYLQDDKYFFEVPVDDVIAADVAYTAGGVPVTPEVDTTADRVAIKVDYAVIGGVQVPVLMLPEQNILPDTTLEGIFVQSSPLILAELAKKCGDTSVEICPYTLDIRGIEMGSEYSDTLLWVVMLAILIFLLIKLIIYHAKPHKHPIFAQLDKYGDVFALANDIEQELKSDKTTFYKKEIYTPEWILTKQSFKYRIGKNHLAGGKFKYTP